MNEGTPSVSSIVIRKQPLTSEEWVDIIESARIRIKPFLNSVTIPKFGDLELFGRREADFAPRTTGMHAVRLDKPAFKLPSGYKFDLDSQGFFLDAGCEIDEDSSNSRLSFWSLTRDGEWRSVEIKCEVSHDLFPHSLNHHAQVVMVSPAMSTSSVISYCKANQGFCTPIQMFDTLRKVVWHLLDQRKAMYERVRSLSCGMDNDFDLIRQVTGYH
jgi:hypothetical protein